MFYEDGCRNIIPQSNLRNSQQPSADKSVVSQGGDESCVSSAYIAKLVCGRRGMSEGNNMNSSGGQQ